MDTDRIVKNKIRMVAVSALLAIGVVMLCGSALAASPIDLQLRYRFEIPSERLDAALIAFGTETHIHLVTSVVPVDMVSPGITGEFSATNALTELLRGTGMSFRQTDAETIAVLPAQMALVRPAQFKLLSDVTDRNALADQSTAAAAPSAAQPAAGLSEVQVTGTRIVRQGYEAPTPVTAVGIQQLQDAPANNIGDTLNQLPVFQGSLTNTVATNTVEQGVQTELNMRNLNANRTLILFDGRRLPTANTENVPDVDLIPDALIQRVDVVTGGASSVYGSDAVAGVVNYILDTNFTGLKGVVQGGMSGYADGPSFKVSLTAGTTFLDGRLHLLFSGDERYQREIFGYPRPWDNKGESLIQNPAYVTNPKVPQYIHEPCCTGLPGVAAGGIILSGPLQGIYFGPGGSVDQYNYGFGLTAAGNGQYGGSWQVGSDHGGFPLVDDDDTAQHFFARVAFDVTPNMQLFVQWLEGSNHSIGVCCWDYYPTGVGTLYTSNPYIPQSVLTQAATAGVTNFKLGETFRFPYSYGNDGGYGINDHRYNDVYTLGLKGSLNIGKNSYNWNLYGQQGLSTTNYSDGFQSINTNLANAIQAVRVGSYGPNQSYGLSAYNAANYPNPLGVATGTITCLSNLLPRSNANATTDCVPFNLFGTGVVSQAAMNYTQGMAFLRQTAQQSILGGDISGEPFSDWAGPISVALDAEYRHESIAGFADPLSQSSATGFAYGQVQTGFFSENFFPSRGSQEVTEGAVETVVPLLKDRPWVQELDLNGAARATDYSTSGYVTTYKYGVEYTPINDLRFRAVASEDIRAPNLNDLFGFKESHGASTDPFFNNASAPSYSITGGNLNLKPEKAHQYEIGLVVQPSEIPGLNLSVDYYHINITGAIGSLSGAFELQSCYNSRIAGTYTGTSPLCALIVRNADNSLFSVKTTPFNLASYLAEGVDYNFDYRKQLTEMVSSWRGGMELHLSATNTIHLITNTGIAGPSQILDATGSGGVPRWAVYGTLSYDLDPWRFTWTERYDSAVLSNNTTIVCQTNCPNPIPSGFRTLAVAPREAAYFLAMFSVNYKFMQHDQKEAEAFVSINNVFNRPPNFNWGVVPDYHINVNTSLNDSIGLYARAGVRFRL